MEYPKRKRIRLEGYDYDSPGYYFITICTKEKAKILCDITYPNMDGPQIRYTADGERVKSRLEYMKRFYEHITLEKYVIMPNHIHLLLHIAEDFNGPSGRVTPQEGEPKAMADWLVEPMQSLAGPYKFRCGKIHRELQALYQSGVWKGPVADAVK